MPESSLKSATTILKVRPAPTKPTIPTGPPAASEPAPAAGPVTVRAKADAAPAETEEAAALPGITKETTTKSATTVLKIRPAQRKPSGPVIPGIEPPDAAEEGPPAAEAETQAAEDEAAPAAAAQAPPKARLSLKLKKTSAPATETVGLPADVGAEEEPAETQAGPEAGDTIELPEPTEDEAELAAEALLEDETEEDPKKGKKGFKLKAGKKPKGLLNRDSPTPGLWLFLSGILGRRGRKPLE